MAVNSCLSGWAAMAAALSMAVSPAAAADLPAAGAGNAAAHSGGVFDADAVNADNHRYYRYRRNRVDAGDVLTGVLIVGGIAAIANAAKNNNRNRDYRDRDYRYRDRRGDSRYDGGRGLDNAVEMCVSRVERDARVESVDNVDRTGEGWRVEGSLYDGQRFNCTIGPDGRIEDIDMAGASARADLPANANDRQWSDDRYAAAWQNARSAQQSVPQPAASGRQPAYPGGPIDGESEDDIYAADAPVDGDIGAANGASGSEDDRYTMADANG